MTGMVKAGDVQLWVDQRGSGPDVLLIAGLTDPAEAWELQLDGLADRYRLTAFDNRGVGRTGIPPGELSVPAMTEDAAELMNSLDIESAHVLGFSGGALIAQELALCHPELVRSLVLVGSFAQMDDYAKALLGYWHWLAEVAPDERRMLDAFFLWVYTPRAHADGTVAQFIDDALAFPHQQTLEGFQRQIEAFSSHSTLDRLHAITAPTLVITGGADMIAPPRFGRQVADSILGARFEVMEGEAHQPFQEVPGEFNARVDAFWRDVERSEDIYRDFTLRQLPH